jgi:hypothetical protein
MFLNPRVKSMDDRTGEISRLLHGWLERQLPDALVTWINDKHEQLESDSSDRALYLAISLVPRKLGKADLQLSDADFAAAGECRSGWDPREWSVDQAGRLLLLLRHSGSETQIAERVAQLCRTGDVGELVTFYRGLPLYPDSALYVARAAEGIRSNMKAVFEAVAHRNPYPSESLDEGAWNQMVLKALFVGSLLKPVVGLDQRSNPALAQMLCDYAHERWSAGRPVSPELWRCVGPHADEAGLADLERALSDAAPSVRDAAVLALTVCPFPRARQVLEEVEDLLEQVRTGEISWETVV